MSVRHSMIGQIIFILLCSLPGTGTTGINAWIRINQIGYRTDDIKVAVLVSKKNLEPESFELIDYLTDEVMLSSENISAYGEYGPFQSTFRLNFSALKKQGKYYIRCSGVISPVFRIGEQVYDGAADFLLKYMRQQRCGFNPFLQDSCHTSDGFTIYGPMPDGTHIDVTGGWHDAADYLQYVATSANATFNMLFAWRDHPHAFMDKYQANGLPGSNNIADVLDEARWGLDWLLKMHPRDRWMFNQIADDRDHAGFRLPNHDSVSYGQGRERPVYFCSGEVQGLFGHRNRTTGVASTAGKFASAFALGAQIYESLEPVFASELSTRALSAFNLGLEHPGVCQTAPGRAPYFYEEDNWVDDMELAAASLYRITQDRQYFDFGSSYSKQENVTPWMGADTANHYQWYPFLNIGHYELAIQAPVEERKFLESCYRQGIDLVFEKARGTPFLNGVPFIWCSNNLVSAMITQCYLYRKLTGDGKYLEMETALRDWLFGCNIWGVSMVVGMPAGGVTARDPHSSLSHLYDYPVDGGLLDGPVYGSIFNRLQYIHLTDSDEYAPFQSDIVVYHDDVGDYSTNEPTMDGTATLIYYLALMADSLSGEDEKVHGAVIRGDTTERTIALIFTGDEYADGGTYILKTLQKENISASFFFTGNFYRNPDFSQLIRSIYNAGHYLGAHSDRHLLYCSWEDRTLTLVERDSFETDLKNNYREMRRYGIDAAVARFYLPPYEWYNRDIATWTEDLGLTLINHTDGTLSAADYTIPSMGIRYRTSEEIHSSILSHALKVSNGLNGFLLLMHIGTHPERTDKYYFKLPDLIQNLKSQGYRFKRVDQLLK